MMTLEAMELDIPLAETIRAETSANSPRYCRRRASVCGLMRLRSDTGRAGPVAAETSGNRTDVSISTAGVSTPVRAVQRSKV